ncbi:MAG: hypothetical protein KDA91_25280 [Planctomycetaceae bacterium]|nr:hypothetical protein [Planctomycetaceae bacterium]
MPRCWRWKRPEIADWPGQVVTGTFCHRAARTIDLTIAGESSPIGCTANHPFWSEDRQDFVRADSLQPGETLRTTNGLTTVVSTTTVPGQTFVYNLEVHGLHVYHVGESGILVHNSCYDTARRFLAKHPDLKGTMFEIAPLPAREGHGGMGWMNVGLIPGYEGIQNAHAFTVIRDNNGILRVFDDAAEGIPLDDWIEQYRKLNQMSEFEMQNAIRIGFPLGLSPFTGTNPTSGI